MRTRNGMVLAGMVVLLVATWAGFLLRAGAGRTMRLRRLSVESGGMDLVIGDRVGERGGCGVAMARGGARVVEFSVRSRASAESVFGGSFLGLAAGVPSREGFPAWGVRVVAEGGSGGGGWTQELLRGRRGYAAVGAYEANAELVAWSRRNQVAFDGGQGEVLVLRDKERTCGYRALVLGLDGEKRGESRQDAGGRERGR